MFKTKRNLLLSVSISTILPLASGIVLLSASCDNSTKQIKKTKNEISSLIKNNVKRVVANDKTLDKSTRDKLLGKEFNDVIDELASLGIDFFVNIFESLGLTKSDFINYYNNVIKNNSLWKEIEKGQKSFEELSKLFSQIGNKILSEQQDKLNSYFIKAWKKNHYLSEAIKENNLSDNDLNEIIKLLSDNFDKVNNKGAVSNLFIGGYDSDKNIYNKPNAQKQEEMRKIIEANLNSVNTNKKYANFNKQLSKYITETIVNNAHRFPPLIKKFKELNVKIINIFS